MVAKRYSVFSLRAVALSEEKATQSPVFNLGVMVPNKLLNIPFATPKNICYFENALAKSGVGFRIPFLNRGISSYLVMVDCLGRSIGSAVSLFSGNANPLWSATISFASSGSGLSKLKRGTTMNVSWCLLGGVCHRISYAFFNSLLTGVFQFGGAM